jgi:hypothetical protein
MVDRLTDRAPTSNTKVAEPGGADHTPSRRIGNFDWEENRLRAATSASGRIGPRDGCSYEVVTL